MNPTIKARIESIRRGEVPEGYKRTKIGIVPNEWNEYNLGDFLEEYKEKTMISNQYPVLTSSRKGLMLQKEYYSRRQVTTDDNIGYNVIPFGFITYRSRSDDGRFCFNENTIIEKGIISYFYPVFSVSANAVKTFVLYLMNETIYRRMIPYAEGTAQQVLSLKQLCSLKYFFPTVSEQEKIAEILAGQDRVIVLKEKLLAEKQKQKKYLMQQLFMHDIKEWIRLSEIANVIMGQSPDSKYYNDKMIGLPLLQGNADLKDGYPLPRIYTTSVTKKCEKNDILLSVRAPVGCVFRSNIVACIGRGISAIRSREHQEYLYHFLIFYEEKWKSVAQGSTFEAISGNDIRNLLIPIVADKEKVCKVLSTADKEIELLKKDIEQEKLKKKSLMQLLLTGIVRVDELVS